MSPPISHAEITGKLFPMAVANYLAKREDAQHIGQFAINGIMLDDSSGISERISEITSRLSSKAAEAEVLNEVEVIHYTISDDESGINNKARLEYFGKCDTTQALHRTSGLNLDHFIENGLIVRLSQSTSTTLGTLTDSTGEIVPFLERLKAERLLTINGFSESRVMHLVHDVVDHPWLFATLRNKRVFEKYSDLLSSIDFTEESYLYSRQAELIASVGFGLRRWELVNDSAQKPILVTSDVEELLSSSQDDRCIETLEIFKQLDGQTRDKARFVIENMAIQIADERRRYGSVKQITSEGAIRPMNLLDPLYIAFLIESVVVVSGALDFESAQVQTACMVEEILEEIILNNEFGNTFIIRPSRLGRAYIPSLGQEKIDWFTKNKAQLTTYSRIQVDK